MRGYQLRLLVPLVVMLALGAWLWWPPKGWQGQNGGEEVTVPCPEPPAPQYESELVHAVRSWLQVGMDEPSLECWDHPPLTQALDEVNLPLERLYRTMAHRYKSKAQASKRIKSLNSLSAKIQDKNSVKPHYTIRDVQDLGGVRLVFRRLKDLKKAVSQIEKEYDVINTQDYVTHPKGGYRSIHVVVYFQRVPIEIQLRSERMDLWARWIHDTLYKNRQLLLERLGGEKLREFDRYAADLSDYLFALDCQQSTDEPPPPEGLAIFWELARPEERVHMLPDGRLKLS